MIILWQICRLMDRARALEIFQAKARVKQSNLGHFQAIPARATDILNRRYLYNPEDDDGIRPSELRSRFDTEVALGEW